MRYRTIWISDLHLGTRHCDAEGVLDFLRHHDCERLYRSATSWICGTCAETATGCKPTTT